MATEILNNCSFDSTQIVKLYVGNVWESPSPINLPIPYKTVTGNTDILYVEEWASDNSYVYFGGYKLYINEVQNFDENIQFVEELIIDNRGMNYKKTLTFSLPSIDLALMSVLKRFTLNLDSDKYDRPPTIAFLIDVNGNTLCVGYDFLLYLDTMSKSIGDDNLITLSFVSTSKSRGREFHKTIVYTVAPSVTPSVSSNPTPSVSSTPYPTPTPSSITISGDFGILLIGGGGSGGTGSNYACGGGGGGGYVYSTGLTINAGSYSVVIGNGGATVSGGIGSNGGNTTFSGLTAYGGGGGGFPNVGGASGGCGGGAGIKTSYNVYGGTGSQGFDGGDTLVAVYQYAAGGGGIGAVGGDTNSQHPGNGGAGRQFPGFGTDYYGGGGGGAMARFNYDDPSIDGGYGGIGGGGDGLGGGSGSAEAENGTPNTGGGGGGGFPSHFGTIGYGGSGGSGIAKFRYLTSSFGNCTGGVKTTDGSYTNHTFTSSGTLIIVSP